MPWLINAAQVDKFRKNQKNLMILDATCHCEPGRDAQQEFVERHIAGAHFFPLSLFNDPNATLPMTLLQDPTLISQKLSALGIKPDCKIIFYDNSERHSACRALWMFKVFGHNPHLLYILDGGLKAWEDYGGKIESGQPNVNPKTYTAHLDERYLASLSMVKAAMAGTTQQIVDLRHAVRYCGGPETRPGLRRGHIPGSLCLPYMTLFDKDGKFIALDKIRRKLSDINVDLSVPIITTCGSGLTAAILDFVLDLLEHQDHRLYDGSWAEWGAEQLYPGETSLAERPVATCVD